MDIFHPRLNNAPRPGSIRAALSNPELAAARLEADGIGLTVDVVDDLRGFEALRDEWGELLQDSTSDCIFLTWEWLFTWWKHLAGERQLYLITVRRGGRLVGIAPLAVRPRQPERLFPFRALEFLGTGNVGSDYLDFIIRRGEEEQVTRSLAVHFSKCRLMFELSQVKLTPTHTGRFAAFLSGSGWSVSQMVTEICPYMSLGGLDWESYLGTLGRAHRYNVRRRLKNLQSSFQVSWELAASEEARRRCFRALLDLHEARWSTRDGSDALHSQALVGFHDEWSRLALKRGWLRLYLLSLDGAPVAAVYGFSYLNVFHFYQSGFDPAYSAHSVGMVALAMSIRAALEEGVQEYDLLHGSEAYKFLWTDKGRDLSRLNLYPPNSHGLLYKQAIRLRQGVKKVVLWPRQALAH